MIADLFSLYSCCGQSATKFSNCLYRACNCSNVIVYRRHPVSSMIPRCSTGMEITRLIPYFILLLDCGPGFPGPGFNLLVRNDLAIAAKQGHGIRPIFKRFGGFGRVVFRFVVGFGKDDFFCNPRAKKIHNAIFADVGVGIDVDCHNKNGQYCFREPARSVGTINVPGTKIVFFLNTKQFFLIFRKNCIFLGSWCKIPGRTRYICIR